MPDERYHIRRKDKTIGSADEMFQVLQEQPYMTIAMCSGEEPYLVTVNHAYDRRRNSLYFHCAPEGRKVEMLRANPRVWGQVLEDRGYVEGECDYDYRCVEFEGQAVLVSDAEEKRRALEMLVEKLESHPDEAKKKHITDSSVKKVAVFRIDISSMTGKKRTR